MNYTVIAYCIYLPITLLLTVWVARTLFTNGRIFLVEIFRKDETLADSVNKLLLVGFYLVNIGYAVYTLRVSGAIARYAGYDRSAEREGGLDNSCSGRHAFLQSVCVVQPS